MKFNDAVEIVLKHEGGYINHAKDPGGETNFGISKKAFPNLDIKKLSIDDAKEIYRKLYWEACRCNELPPKLRLIVFDGAVNQGKGAMIGLLQVIAGAKVDGIMGDETIKKIWEYPLELAVEKLAALRCARYFDSPKFKFFGEGWLLRLVKISVRTMAEE